ncbi:major facilitator superfamily domain-containing protein 12-like protein [Carex littledalei]|uniref:Major facilitator superfamily domain-containing protein 12-like protein n=1 Tax=Carex littledalei TaxID=544730 RepID=A0A833QGK4_9POAL|nr:major facilitator superfamily domain-containing protein 12-like protein [Carex littledalei]
MVHETNTDSPNEEPNTSPLGRSSILSYGSGHMLNDITSSCWFTYLLLFLTDVGLTPRNAAIVMLSGQVADAFTTIFVGELIDRIGHFKLWHAGGSILVAISFSSVFGGCVPCKLLKSDTSALETIGYSVFAAIFNVGWAITQVSHMAMVNCITLNPTSRVSLASCRNAFTMVANLSLYAIALSVFTVFNNTEAVNIILQYRWIAYLSIFLGCCFVVVFLIGTKEPQLKQQIQSKNVSRISWAHWFKKALYYQVAMVYMLTRLVTNVSQSLLAFYVINDLGMGQSSKATVPAIIYICSFIISVILQEMRWSSWRIKSFFTIGAVLWIFSGVGVFILPSALKYFIYALSVTIGVANALMTVTAISMESILVGEDLNGCAFVYGSLSFTDKLSCGLALYALESYQATPDVKSNCLLGLTHSVTRLGLGLLPSVCAFISIVVTHTMDLQHRRPKPLVEPLLV